MHDQIVCRNIEPLQKLAKAQYYWVVSEEFLVIKPDDIVIVDMMPEVLVTNVFISAISGPAQPGQKPTERRIVTDTSENEIVATFVNHVGSYRHSVRQ